MRTAAVYYDHASPGRGVLVEGFGTAHRAAHPRRAHAIDTAYKLWHETVRAEGLNDPQSIVQAALDCAEVCGVYPDVLSGFGAVGAVDGKYGVTSGPIEPAPAAEVPDTAAPWYERAASRTADMVERGASDQRRLAAYAMKQTADTVQRGAYGETIADVAEQGGRTARKGMDEFGRTGRKFYEEGGETLREGMETGGETGKTILLSQAVLGVAALAAGAYVVSKIL